MCSRSMTTEVSRSPRTGRRSGIGYNVLASPRIDVGTEAAGVDGGRIPEDGNDRRRRHESMAPQGSQLAYRHTVASDDEGLPLVEPAHDLAAVIAELTLGDGFRHASMVARRATDVDGLAFLAAPWVLRSATRRRHRYRVRETGPGEPPRGLTQPAFQPTPPAS